MTGILLISILGCVAQEYTPVNVNPYKLDNALEVLQSQCVSTDFDGCDRVKLVKMHTEKMVALHVKQMKRFVEPIKKLKNNNFRLTNTLAKKSFKLKNQ